MNAAGIDLSTKTDDWLKRQRAAWKRQFGRWVMMDKTLLAAVAEIDAELARRREQQEAR